MVLILGPLPPPIHGMSTINNYVKTMLESSDTDVKLIPIQPSYLHTIYGTRIWLAIKYLHSLLMLLYFFLLCIRYPGATSYISLSGGKSQIIDLFFLSIARLFQHRIFIHHHSYYYVDNYQPLTNAIASITGTSTTHIFLCECMKDKFLDTYTINSQRTYVIPNLAYFEFFEHEAPLRGTCRTAGILSNINFDKGIDEFVETIVRSNKLNQFTGLIAGPCMDKATETFVRKSVGDLAYLNYLGPVYAQDKNSFFNAIDVFLFPTKYKNEADPVVIYEALSRGIPVIAYARGCIGSIVKDIGGISISVNQNFPKGCADILREWSSHPDKYAEESRKIRHNFATRHAESKIILQGLISDLTGTMSIKNVTSV